MNWKAGDWCVFDLSVVQIKELGEGGCATVSDSFFETSGMLVERLRPLTLRNKRIVETFDTYYNRLREINGEGGFNYPRIFSYFSQLALNAIDVGDTADAKVFFDKGGDFVNAARDYKPVIDGVQLFRPKLGAG